MRIGIDARMYRSSVAGIGRYSQNLIHNLLEIDHNDQFVLFMTGEDYREFKNPKSKIQMTNKNPNVKIQITNIPHFSLAEQTKLPAIIEQENLDLMHFLNVNYPILYRGKFIVTIHDLTLLFYPETAKKTNIIRRYAFKKVIKRACQNSAKIIAVSESTKKDIIKKFQISNDKIQVIYEAADEVRRAGSQKSDIRNKYCIDKPAILYVGQFRKHKNVEGLIKAFEILNQKIPSKLVLLGKATEDLLDTSIKLSVNPERSRRVDKTRKNPDIVMPGFVSDDDLAAWYKIASVFVFPSFYEGFGLPGLEAMTAGTPVAASNNSSLPEIYKNAAIYFDPFDVKDIADKIKKVLENPKLRQELIANGRKVVKEYSWRKTAEQTLELYKQLENQKSE